MKMTRTGIALFVTVGFAAGAMTASRGHALARALGVPAAAAQGVNPEQEDTLLTSVRRRA